MRHPAAVLATFIATQFLVTAAGASIITTAVGGGPDHLPALLANLDRPIHVVQDGAGNVYLAVGANAPCRVFKIDPSGTLTHFAGSGNHLSFGDGGPAVAAGMVCGGLAVDSIGNVLISDSQRIRKVDVSTGIISTVAGGGPVSPNHGDGGPALSAELGGTQEIALDAAGNLYIADAGFSRIRRVDATSQVITTYAGGGPFASNWGNGGPATSAYLDQPTGISVDGAGNLYIADTNHFQIRRVDPATGIIDVVASTLVCGNQPPGSCPQFFYTRSPRSDAEGNVYFLAFPDSFPSGCYPATIATVFRIDADTGVVAAVAGGQCEGFSGDGGPATSAAFRNPRAIGLAANGDLLIPDTQNLRLRVVDRLSGIIDTRAGNGSATLSGDGFPATSASVFPGGAALDPDGNIFVVDRSNERVRRVDASTGIIETFAGGGTSLSSGPVPKTSMRIRSQSSVAVDHAGNVYIADPGIIVFGVSAGRVWRVDAGSDQIYQFVGGTSGGISSYYGLAIDAADNLYISADAPDRVFVISPACFYCVVAGNGTEGYSGDGGPAIAAQMRNPRGIAVDSSGNVYIVDSGNQRVRRVDASTGVITTVAGNGTRGFGGDGGPGTAALLADPFGVAIASDGAVLISDTGNQRVRRLDPATGTITTVAGNGSFEPLGNGGDALLAGLWVPQGIAAGPEGDFYVAEPFIGRLRLVSSGPSARAGQYPPAECTSAEGATITLDGSASLAPGSAIALFEWFENYDDVTQQLLGTGETLAVTLPVGSHLVTLRVTDLSGESDTDTISIVVRDTTAPALTCPPERFFGCATEPGATITGFVAVASEACGSVMVTNDHNAGGADASGFYSVGTTLVTFEAVDEAGNRSTCSQAVTVETNAASPPVVQVEVSPSILKPHNRRMVRVNAQVSAESSCGATTFVLTSIISNEPDDAPGGSDGSTTNDIQEAAIGSPDTSFLLRAERDSGGDGRIYTIVYTATDPAGQTATGTAEVLVPKKGNIKAADLQTLEQPPERRPKGGKGAPSR
jgi:streptogramin lyase